MTASKNILCIHHHPSEIQIQIPLNRRGFAVEMHEAADADAVLHAFQQHWRWDLILCDWSLNREFGVSNLIAGLQNDLDASFILLKLPGTSLSPAEGYRYNAQDVVTYNDIDHLLMVCLRELGNVQIRRQFRELRGRLEQGGARMENHGPTHDPGLMLATIRDMTPQTARVSRPAPAEDELKSPLEVTEARQLLHRRINTLINQGGLTLEFQPIVSFRMNEEPHGMFEALVRLKNENGALLNPGDFLPIVAEAGWMGRIDLWIFRRALATLENIQGNGSPNAMFFINLDTQTLLDPELTRTIGTFVAAAHVKPGSVVIEVRRDAFTQAPESLERLMSLLRVKRHGMLLEDPDIHDYSFIERHQSLLTHLKLDRSITQGLVEHRIATRVLETCVACAHRCGMQVIALAVDNAQLLPILFKSNVDAIQGHFVSMPYEGLIYPNVQRIEAAGSSASWIPAGAI